MLSVFSMISLFLELTVLKLTSELQRVPVKHGVTV